MDGTTGVVLVEKAEQEPMRLLALSDGLFATVLTVLVLDLRLPNMAQAISSSALQPALLNLWPHLFGYFITFIMTGLYWLAHHRAFASIVRVNRMLLWYNLVFLLFVGLLPFSTAGLGSQFSPISWTVYALDMGLVGAMMALIWFYASSHALTDPAMPARFVRYFGARFLLTPGMFLISIVIVFAFPQTIVAPMFLLLIPVLQRVQDRLFFGQQQRETTRRIISPELGWRLVALLPFVLFFALTLWIFSGVTP